MARKLIDAAINIIGALIGFAACGIGYVLLMMAIIIGVTFLKMFGPDLFIGACNYGS